MPEVPAVTTESRLDWLEELIPGDCGSMNVLILFSEAEGEVRLVPRLTLHVGHNLTKREMSSLGTLGRSACGKESSD